MNRMLMLAIMMFASAGILTTGCKTCQSCSGDFCTLPKAVNADLDIEVSAKSASLQDGVSLRINLHNTGNVPQSFQVCPTMSLCCVKGLAPMLAYDDTGMSLLNVCQSAKPKVHETYLPAGSEFAFDLTIPIDKLPEACRKAGKPLSFSFRYLSDTGVTTDSNTVTVELKNTAR